MAAVTGVRLGRSGVGDGDGLGVDVGVWVQVGGTGVEVGVSVAVEVGGTGDAVSVGMGVALGEMVGGTGGVDVCVGLGEAVAVASRATGSTATWPGLAVGDKIGGTLQPVTAAPATTSANTIHNPRLKRRITRDSYLARSWLYCLLRRRRRPPEQAR
ncbi:MAG: hypothetical protein JXA93_05945 [Anaerolineae bacterium]|nr:hypothetical protein [Anaerolineae bacterium]